METGAAAAVCELTDTSQHTVYSLLRTDLSSGEQRSNRWAACVALVCAWVWPVVFIGRFRPNSISRAVGRLGPQDWILGVMVGLVLILILFAVATRRKDLVRFCAMILAFQVGHFVAFDVFGPFYPRGGWGIPFRGLSSAAVFAQSRLVYLAGMLLPMLVVYFLFFRKRVRFPFAWGDWSPVSRLFGTKEVPKRWGRHLLDMAVFSAILLVLFQIPLRFRPITEGYLWPAAGAILIAAFINSFIEEVIFRGFLQSALGVAAGPGWSLWGTGALFGLVHWGASVGILAALPTSLLIGFGSVAWGKSVLDTRGLSWVICAHAFVDVAVMSAYFVRP